MENNMKCSFEGCENKVAAVKLCRAHYNQHHRGKELTPIYDKRKVSVEERLEKYTERDSETGCLVWTKTKSTDGYAVISIDGKIHKTARVMYERRVGEIPANTNVVQTCRNRACVEPTHLELKSQTELRQKKYRLDPRSSTGYRNVYVRGERYLAKISKDNRRIYVGMFDTPEEAGEAVKKARQELFGE